MDNQGIPANTNPFSINADQEIADGAFNDIAPGYFGDYEDYGGPCASFAHKTIISPALSQEEAEKLFTSLASVDAVDCLVVHEDFIHIIPKDWPEEIWITKSTGETCSTSECYKFKPSKQ